MVDKMSGQEFDYTYTDIHRDTLRRESSYLRKLAMKLAYQYISDASVRIMFLTEVEELITKTELEVSNYCLSFSTGLDNISNEIERLEKQEELLRSKSIMQYALLEVIHEKDVKEKNNKLILKQIGFISGSMQTIGGFTSCIGSVGALCSSLGVGLVSHGVNSTIENGYYLLFREDLNGPIRNGYRTVSSTLGYGDDEADIFYNVVDLSLSGALIMKPILKEDAWKLFYYIKSDFINSWKTMGGLSVTSEFIFDGMTIYSTYNLHKGEDKNG